MFYLYLEDVFDSHLFLLPHYFLSPKMTDVDGLSLSVKHSSTKKRKALVRSSFPRNGIEIYLERIKKLTCFNNIVYFPVLRLGILSFLGCTGLKRTKSQKTCNAFQNMSASWYLSQCHGYAIEPEIQIQRDTEDGVLCSEPFVGQQGEGTGGKDLNTSLSRLLQSLKVSNKCNI